MRQNYDANLTKPVLKATYRNREAAEYLGVSPNTLNNWRVQGKSPKYSKASGKNGMIFYTLDSLVSWLEAGQRTSTSDNGKGQ
jgi:transposase